LVLKIADLRLPPRRLLLGSQRVMGYDQAQLLPTGFIERLLLVVGDLGLKLLQDFHKLPIASGGHGQNKLQRSTLTELDGLQRLDIVKR
ncbi:MAG: hypothetical protein ACK55I_17895, partial [bacterium]